MNIEIFKTLVNELASDLDDYCGGVDVEFDEVDEDELLQATLKVTYFASNFEVPVWEKNDGKIGIGSDPDFLGGGNVESVFMYLFNKTYFENKQMTDRAKNSVSMAISHWNKLSPVSKDLKTGDYLADIRDCLYT